MVRRDLLRLAGWFLFLNTPFFLLTNFRYFSAVAIPHNPFVLFFVAISLLGHFAMLAFIPALILLPLILLYPRPKAVLAAAVICQTAVATFLTLDCLVFYLYRFHLNGMVWEMLTHGAAKEILPITAGTYQTAAIIISALLAIEIFIAWLAQRWIRQPKRAGKYFALAVILSLFGGHAIHIWADAAGYNPITRLARIFPAYPAITAKRSFEKFGIWQTNVDRSQTNPVAAGSNLTYPIADPGCGLGGSRPNILYIAIDSWRYDMLTADITPQIEQFSRRAIRFENHSAAANTTRYGLFTLFYGIPGTYFGAFLGEQKGPVLISSLLKLNYQFAVFASAPLYSPEFDQTVFSEIRDRIPLETAGATPADRDIEIHNRFLKFLDSREKDRPFFGFLFFDGPHGYSYPVNYAGPFKPDNCNVEHLSLNRTLDPSAYRNCYKNAAHFDDELVGKILDRLSQSGLLDNTIVVITADHGEEFNDLKKNYWGHNSNYAKYQTKVPLVVHWPGKPPGEIQHMTTHLDLTPTILKGALGCTGDSGNYGDGVDLFNLADRLPLIVGNWDHFCLTTASRYDVFYNFGGVDSFDADYNAIDTNPPPDLMQAASDKMSRFFSR